MTSLSAGRRSRRSKAIAVLSLVAFASLVASPWLLREWHAWRGHKLFKEKQFVEALSYLAHVKDGAPLGAVYFGLPPVKYLYAQSLLATGRDAEALFRYSELADLDPRNATLAFIMALDDGKRGNWESAAARLRRHKDSPECQSCEVGHAKFRAAALAQPKVVRAQREQEAHLASMKGPALCLGYRAGSAAAKVLAGKIPDLIGPNMVRYLRASGMTKRSAERVVSTAVSAIRGALGQYVENLAPQALSLGVSCAQSVQLHEMLHIRRIPYVAGIEEWVGLRTLEGYIDTLPYVGRYVGGTKEALQAGRHLYELGVLAGAYVMAHKTESDARGPMSEAHSYARSQWHAIRLVAQKPEFASEGMALLSEGLALVPSEKSWVETIKSYVWPFQPSQ